MEGAIYNFDEDTVGALVVLGFSGNLSPDGLPLGSQKYEQAISQILKVLLNEFTNNNEPWDETKFRSEYTGRNQGKLISRVMEGLNVGDGASGTVTPAFPSWSPGTIFLGAWDGKKLTKKDYKHKFYVPLDYNGLKQKVESGLESRLKKAIREFTPTNNISSDWEMVDADATASSSPNKRPRQETEGSSFQYASTDTRNTLEEVGQWQQHAKEKIRQYSEPHQFEDDYRTGNVSQALRRLSMGLPDHPNKFQKAEDYAREWALALNPKNGNKQELLAANQLDADRRICLDLLYQLYNRFCTDKEVGPDPAKIADFDKGRCIQNILYSVLVFDRAKALYFNETKELGIRGQHWYAKEQERPASMENRSGATINKRLYWFVTKSGCISERFDPWIFKLIQPVACEALTNLLEQH